MPVSFVNIKSKVFFLKLLIFYLFLTKARNDFWCKNLNINLTDTEHKIIRNKCVPGCKEYEYDRSLFHTTVVTEVCCISNL